MRHKMTRSTRIAGAGCAREMDDAHAEFREDKTTLLYVSLKVQELEPLVRVPYR